LLCTDCRCLLLVPLPLRVFSMNLLDLQLLLASTRLLPLVCCHMVRA
jgi:hypothetical protein